MKLSVKETAVFGMLGALMYASKVLMEALPNVHLLGVFVVALTVVYRKKALYPIYTYVFLNGLMAGFSLWWLPYLYLWAILWGTSFVEDICHKKLGKFVPYLQVFEGVVTAWIPGVLMLIGQW